METDEVITTAQLEALMPIVAHRGFRYVEERGLRDKRGYCPVCALVDEIAGWRGDKTDAWWALDCLVGNGNIAPCAVSNIVSAADTVYDDGFNLMPRAKRLRMLLEVK